MSNEICPLPYENGGHLRDASHGGCRLWEVALAQAPPVNHSWGHCHARDAAGVSTQPLPYGRRSFTMEFDFVSHRLVVLTSTPRPVPWSLVRDRWRRFTGK